MLVVGSGSSWLPSPPDPSLSLSSATSAAAIILLGNLPILHLMIAQEHTLVIRRWFLMHALWANRVEGAIRGGWYSIGDSLEEKTRWEGPLYGATGGDPQVSWDEYCRLILTIEPSCLFKAIS